MKKTVGLVLVTIVLAGCAKTGRAWLMDNSPYWDMFYEASRFIVGGAVLGGVIWWWFRDTWRFQGSAKPLLAGLVVFCIFSVFGLYRGYNYIHTACTARQDADRDCPAYKMAPDWKVNYEEMVL